MKKFFLIVFIIFVFAISFFFGIITKANADWSVTAVWEHSQDPNANKEEVLVDGVVKCSVTKNDTAQCTWIETSLAGQAVVIRTYTKQGGWVDGVSTELLKITDPASGLVVNITQVP